jgi:hypothetical protein
VGEPAAGLGGRVPKGAARPLHQPGALLGRPLSGRESNPRRAVRNSQQTRALTSQPPGMLGSRHPAASPPVPPCFSPFRSLLRHTCNMVRIPAIAITRSGRSRSAIPAQVDHLFRAKPIIGAARRWCPSLLRLRLGRQPSVIPVQPDKVESRWHSNHHSTKRRWRNHQLATPQGTKMTCNRSPAQAVSAS